MTRDEWHGDRGQAIDDRPTAAELEPWTEPPRAYAWHCRDCGHGHRSGDAWVDPCEACGRTLDGGGS